MTNKTTPSWEEEFEKLTPDEIPSTSDSLYSSGGVDEWLKTHTTEHLYHDGVYGEPMLDLSKDKVKTFIRQHIGEAERRVAEKIIDEIPDFREYGTHNRPFQTDISLTSRIDLRGLKDELETKYLTLSEVK